MNIQADHYITGDPAFAVDRSGVVVLWNDAAEKVFGHPADQALGKKCWELMCGHDVNGNRYCFQNCPLLEMAFLHEPVNAFQTSFETSSNHQKPFLVSCLTVFNQPGDEMLLHICHPEKQAQTIDQAHAPAVERPSDLSHREKEVLGMLAEKVSTKDIAEHLGISSRTVRTHIQHLMYKLRVHKRKDAIKVGKRLGLIRAV